MNGSNKDSSNNSNFDSSISSNIEDTINKFEEFEKSMKSSLPKVDPRLVLDMLHRRKRDASPMYTLEVFLKGKPNTEEIRKTIIKDIGVMPAFYDNGTHVVVAHRFNLQMLEYISQFPDVEKIRGTFTGSGRGSSIGPVFERDDTEDY